MTAPDFTTQYQGDAGDVLRTRAATASRPSLLRVSGIAGIAIAAESRLFVFYVGACVGSLVTVLSAFCWSLVL